LNRQRLGKFGNRPLKKSQTIGIIAGIFVTLVVAVRLGTPDKPVRADERVATTRPSPAAAANKAPDAEQQLPWIGAVKQACARYKSAPNVIKKSAAFRETSALLSQSTVDGVRGKLTGLSTNQGGGELKLTIAVGGVEFSTESLFAPIEQGRFGANCRLVDEGGASMRHAWAFASAHVDGRASS